MFITFLTADSQPIVNNNEIKKQRKDFKFSRNVLYINNLELVFFRPDKKPLS